MTIGESIKLSKYARAKKDAARSRVVYAICILFPLVMFILAMNSSCQKTVAQQPAAAAAVLSSCADTAGTFVPVISGGFNNGIIQGGHAHFIRVCNEVYVSGVIGASTNTPDTLVNAAVQINLPIPSNLSGSFVRGQLSLTQSGVRQPLVGFVTATADNHILLNWRPTALTLVTIGYSYTYTVN